MTQRLNPDNALPPTQATPPVTARASVAAPRPRLLIVGDDVAVRLHLADLLVPHWTETLIDTIAVRPAVELGAKLKEYAAAVVIIDLGSTRPAGPPLGIVSELRAAQSRRSAPAQSTKARCTPLTAPASARRCARSSHRCARPSARWQTTPRR